MEKSPGRGREDTACTSDLATAKSMPVQSAKPLSCSILCIRYHWIYNLNHSGSIRPDGLSSHFNCVNVMQMQNRDLLHHHQ